MTFDIVTIWQFENLTIWHCWQFDIVDNLTLLEIWQKYEHRSGLAHPIQICATHSADINKIRKGEYASTKICI